MVVRGYQIPYNVVPISVIKVGEDYYSFGTTARSLSGIWGEVKGKLHLLCNMRVTDEEKEEIEPYFVEILEESYNG